MVDKVPGDISPGNASVGSKIHATQADNLLSRSHLEEDISRLQSAVQLYSNSRTYEVGDLVRLTNITYECKTAVTVPGIFDINKWRVPNNASLFVNYPFNTLREHEPGIVGTKNSDTLDDTTATYQAIDISRMQNAVIEYSNARTYKVGDIVKENEQIWQCKTAVTVPESFDMDKWRIPNNATLFSDRTLQNLIDDEPEIIGMPLNLVNPEQTPFSYKARDISRMQSSISEFDTNKTYTVGDIVLHEGLQYRCVSNIIVPGVFLPAEWAISDGIGSKNVVQIYHEDDFPPKLGLGRVLDDNTHYIICAPITLTSSLLIQNNTSVEISSSNKFANTITLDNFTVSPPYFLNTEFGFAGKILSVAASPTPGRIRIETENTFEGSGTVCVRTSEYKYVYTNVPILAVPDLTHFDIAGSFSGTDIGYYSTGAIDVNIHDLEVENKVTIADATPLRLISCLNIGTLNIFNTDFIGFQNSANINAFWKVNISFMQHITNNLIPFQLLNCVEAVITNSKIRHSGSGHNDYLIIFGGINCQTMRLTNSLIHSNSSVYPIKLSDIHSRFRMYVSNVYNYDERYDSFFDTFFIDATDPRILVKNCLNVKNSHTTMHAYQFTGTLPTIPISSISTYVKYPLTFVISENLERFELTGNGTDYTYIGKTPTKIKIDIATSVHVIQIENTVRYTVAINDTPLQQETTTDLLTDANTWTLYPFSTIANLVNGDRISIMFKNIIGANDIFVDQLFCTMTEVN